MVTQPEGQAAQRDRLVGLDGLRGLAALYVVMFHCWLYTFPGFPADRGPAWLGWLMYGRLAVVFFLMLSGFSLAISAARHGWRLGGLIQYARRRAWRILPPYWAALAFSLVIAWTLVPASHFGPPTGRTVVVYGLLWQDVVQAPTPNGAFWSIAIEAELYLAFPLLLLIRRRAGAVALLAAVTLPVLALGLLSPNGNPVEGFNGLTIHLAPVFAAGMVSAGVITAGDRIRRLPWPWLAVLAAAPVLLLIVVKGSVWTVNHYFWIDLAVVPAMAMMLVAVATGGPTLLVRVLASAPVGRLGTFSYSLYLIHLPIIMVISRRPAFPHAHPGLPAFWFTLGLGVPASVLAAWLFSMVFEVPFQRHRARNSGSSSVNQVTRIVPGSIELCPDEMHPPGVTVNDFPAPGRTLIGPNGLAAQLAPSIKAAATELEEHRDIPAKLVLELREAGAFRLLTPRELGGFEAPLTTVLKVFEEFAALDASVAWVVWNSNFGFMGALLDEAGTAQLWSPEAEEPIFAHSVSPGVAIPVDGGYQLSGHWKIVSGINSATWLVVIAVVLAGEGPRITAAGTPDVRLFAVRPDRATINDTWNVNGLRGTGSHDVVIEGTVVPEELTVAVDAAARIDRPLYRGFIPALVLGGGAAIGIGIAQTAIDELVELAPTKTTFTGGTLAEVPRVQVAVARAEAALAAARLLLFSAAQALQDAGERNEPVTIEQRARLRAAMSHAAEVSRDVLVTVYELASSSAIYAANPIEGLFRDGMVALQHFNHSAVAFEGVGRVRFGLDPGMPIF